MKLSNNALNFLLAQYRAIFKRAYVKGIASAVILTAGLAATQANADTLSGGAASWEEVTTSNKVTIANSESGSTPARREEFFNNIIVQQSGTLSNSGAKTQIVVKGTLTNEGTINLNEATGKGWGILGYRMDPTTQAVDTSIATGNFENKATGKLNISGSQLQMANVYMRSGSQTTIQDGALHNDSDDAWWDQAMIVADQDLIVESGATVNMSGGQLVAGLGGTLNIAGTVKMSGDAFLRATDNYNSAGKLNDPNSQAAKIIIGSTADVTVTSGSGGIFGNDVTVQGNLIIGEGSDFTLGGDISGSDPVATAADKSASTNIKVQNGGNITIEKGATVSVGGSNPLEGETLGSSLVIESGGTLVNNSTTFNVDGVLEVADNAQLTGSGTVVLQDNGNLTMSSEKMADYVAQNGKVDAETDGATLTFTDEVDLSTLNIFGDDGIKIGSDTVLAGDGVTITGSLKDTDGTALPGYVGILKESNDTGIVLKEPTDGNFNLAKVVATSTLEIDGGTDRSFTFKGTALTLDRPYFVLNDDGTQKVDACGNPIENSVGLVTGDKIVLANDSTVRPATKASLDAKSGRWVVDNNIEINGGIITATSTNADSPAYLTLTGKIKFTSGTTTFARASKNGTIDLSKASELTFANGTLGQNVNLNATTGGVLVMTGEQIEEKIIGDTTNKVSIKVENGSTLKVVDDLSLGFSDITSGSEANAIRLVNGNNTVDVAGTLTLTTGTEQQNTSTALSLGTNTVKANALVLENLDETKSGEAWVRDTDVEVKDGTLIALSSLTVENYNLLLGSGSAATLTLGDSTPRASYDESGTVNAKNITAESGSDINVYGNWTQNGKMTVNSGSFNVTGSYQGAELKVAADGTATFNGVEDGTASSFTQLTAAGAVNVAYGTLRIDGVAVPGQGTAANTTNPWGVDLEDNAVTVNENATLAFGNVASDNAFTVTNDTVKMSDGFGDIKLDGGTVALDFQNSFQNGINAATLVSLKKTWLNGSGDNGALDGWLDIGDTTISDLATILKPSEDKSYYTATQAEYAPIVDVLASVKNEQVQNLLLTEVKDEVKGVYGALQTTANTKTITFSDDTILSNAGINGGNFATVGATSELAKLDVKGAELTLDSTKSAGAAGEVALNSNSSLKLTGSNAITVATITGSGAIEAHTDTVVNGLVKGNSLNTYADVLVAGNVDINGGITNYDNDKGVTGGSLEASDGNGTYYNVDAAGKVEFAGGYLKAKDVTLGAGGEFTQDAVLTATGTLTLGGTLSLGQASEDVACPDKPDVVGSAGFMDVYELSLRGNDIYIDPDYDQHTSIGATQYFRGHVTSNEFDGGIADGSLYIGQNAAFGIGATLAETQAALERLKLTDSNGALTNGTGSVLYVNRGFTVDQGYKLVLDSTATRSDLRDPQHEANKAANGYSGYIEAESGIIMTDNAFGADMTGTAITFKDDAATIFAEDGAKIILSGQRFTTNQALNLLNDGGNNGVDIVNAEGDGTIRVQTENGLLISTLSGANAGLGVNLTVNPNARAILSGASDPIYQAIVQYAQGDLDGDATTTDDAVVGEGYTPESIAAYEASNPRDPSLLVRNPADNALLTATVNTGNGHAAESAARLALYGGAVQAALTSSKSTSDAIATRMGIGTQAAELTTADNGVGGGLWVAPIYVNSDSDGFEAQGVSYGTDLNLYGVSLGADYAFMPNLRAGIMFNVGSGDADGQGIASNVTNDFDYWGLGIYAGYTYGAFTVVGDFGYSTVDNDVKAGSGLAEIGELSSSMDAAIYTVGVTAQYGLAFSGIDIKPHAGLRYSFVDLDDYSVDSSVAGEVAGYEADSMSVFSIPVGVTFSKDIVSENWTVKPSFDLTLTGNFGDDEAEGTVGWTGVANLDKSLTTEVFDNFTYGATLGISAQNTSGFALGVNVGYTGSSNVDDLSVGANARFTF